ncbi:nucleotidyltransferase family protein [Pyxidicoccus parkwayensis]|uniref:Nucleotidyltransferase family protein n=1 Tax=Pyxidicoccus parkwayensis TaxID=2813578 RepID=A0ABX7NMW9_9BACT|nr:nucleotidyltransferase family protein [Pyxidicoccus parkwaysis]QSQ20205.1 nucleotidyltransferase family protein [Pyxidicoccus parkwaysis]
MDARALGALLRSWPGAPLREAPTGGEARGLVRAAVHHGLAGFVEHAAEKAGWVLPAEARAGLRRASLLGAARVMRVKALLTRSLDTLATVDCVPVLLKGYGLSERLYPDPLQRATMDVDLLVARGEVDAAVRALSGVGLTVRAEDGARHGEEDSHHLELVGEAGLVELHFRALAGWGEALEGDALLARAVEGEVEGRRVRWLRPEDEAVYLALHASNHLLQRLAWVFDLKMLALKGVDWRAVVEGARGTAFPQGVWYGWEAARRLLDAPVPEEVLEALAPPGWQRALAQRFFSEERLLGAELARSKPAWVAAKLLLAPRPGAMARYALRRVENAVRVRR